MSPISRKRRASSSDKDASPKPKKTNVSRACVVCRKKRMRCDGRPRCATCTIYNQECVYDREKDGRKTVSKHYVQALEERVRFLETQLAQRETQAGDGATPCTPCKRTSMPGAIKISGRRSLAHYGPSSAYMHLQDEQVAATEDGDGISPAVKTIEEVDWSQLDFGATLPPTLSISAETHAALLRVFFDYLAGWCAYAEEAEFISNMVVSASKQSTPLRNSYYSPFLHNAILALALLNAPELDPYPQSPPPTSMILAGYAYGMVEAELAEPLTTTPRGLLLIGSYHFHHTQRNFGWTCSGLGPKTAQILGLNIDAQDLVRRGIMTQKMKQQRDRTFWTVYIQDILWTFNVGRSPSFYPEDFEIELPPIDTAADERPWQNGQSTSSRGRSCLPSWQSSCFHWTARLACIGSAIQRTLYRVRQIPMDDIKLVVSRIEVDLSNWLVELPSPLRLESWEDGQLNPALLNMHAVFHYFRLLLHRSGCLLFEKGEEEPRARSVALCEVSAQHLRDVFRRYPSIWHATTTLPNIAVTAGMTFLQISTRGNSEVISVDEAVQAVDDFIQWLGSMSWPAASVGKAILQRLKDEWNPSPSGTSGPLQELQGQITMDALKDPSSTISNLLIQLGWAPPQNAQPAAVNQMGALSSFSALPPSSNAGFGTYNQFLDMSQEDITNYLNPWVGILPESFNDTSWL